MTSDDTLASRLRQMRNFGFADNDHAVEFGINAKMSEPAAAMGLTSLECSRLPLFGIQNVGTHDPKFLATDSDRTLTISD